MAKKPKPEQPPPLTEQEIRSKFCYGTVCKELHDGSLSIVHSYQPDHNLGTSYHMKRYNPQTGHFQFSYGICGRTLNNSFIPLPPEESKALRSKQREIQLTLDAYPLRSVWSLSDCPNLSAYVQVIRKDPEAGLLLLSILCSRERLLGPSINEVVTTPERMVAFNAKPFEFPNKHD